jgi:OmcA/MtrC family decaheme c-type cytochrome
MAGKMKITLIRWGYICVMLAAFSGCGGGGGESVPAPVLPANTVIAMASAVAANDTSVNTSASFTVLQSAGIAAVTVNGPPVVNFTVFSDGIVKTGLTVTNVSFAIAKLVPGAPGEQDQWVNYIYRREIPAAGVGPGGVPVLAAAWQATTDGKETDPALLAAQLVYNPDGYYTYTFKTDIKSTAQTNGVVFEPSRTHRIAIQLSYKNAAGDAVLVNPYVDFTIDANGKSVLVTDPAKTRKMTDVSSCNGCHEKLALHGGGRVDTQFCVMCHNPGTTDANSGNVLNMATMVHKIHAGKLLYSQLATGGEDYTIWGYGNSKHSYAEVGFPQDLRNCAVCHSGANPQTPQGDNWKTHASKGACLTCHASKVGSKWEVAHALIAVKFLGTGAQAIDLRDGHCAGCHSAGSAIAPERVHWNQNEVNAANYKMNIESVAFNDTTDHKARTVTVKYFMSDPTKGNLAYNLLTADCTYTGTAGACIPPGTRPTITSKFGNLRFYLAYQNIVGQSSAVTEFSAYTNGGSSAAVYAHTGINDGNNHYTVNIPLPDDSVIAVAKGTARVVSIGQIVEPKLEAISAADPRPVVAGEFVNTVAQHTFKDVVLSGSLQPRRIIVSNDKCNVCHGALGTTAGSNTADNAFHSGARNTVEACVVCHDANKVSSTVMTNGSSFNESYQFKRMIHGIHGNSRRASPFTHDNKVVGIFCNPAGTTQIAKDLCTANAALPVPLVLASDVTNYAAEVAYPGVGLNCNACHVNNSYQQDLGTLGAVVQKGTGVTDPNGWKVISPKVATCTACHDSAKAIDHVSMNIGDLTASFGKWTQGELAGLPRETCDECHAIGKRMAVDVVHGQK